MAIATVKVTIKKTITRDSARKTIERLFMQDRAFAKPIKNRSANFEPLPKRRGGRIWTKYPNKVHPDLKAGAAAKVKATVAHLADLKSVADFVEVAKA